MHAHDAPAMNPTATVVPEDDGFVAHCLEVDVASQGGTVEEALANLKEALELYFDVTPPPVPRAAGGATPARRRPPRP